MASTYVNDLRLNEMATGDASGSWGTVTNTNLELIGEAFGYGTETIGNADTTITVADGAADPARSFYLKIDSSADLTTTRVITLAPNTVSKVWIIENATTGSQIITIKQGTGATINIPNGHVKMIASNGGGSGAIIYDLLTDLNVATNLFVKNAGTGDGSTANIYLQTAEADIAADDVIGKINFQAPNEGTGTDAILVSAAIQAISEGDFSSTSNATSLNFMTGASEAATTKMTLTSGGDLKLVTDSAVLGFGADNDTTLTHTDGSGLTLNSTNKIMFNDTSQFIQGSSATVLSIAATDEIDLTATAIDLNGTLDVSGTALVTGVLTTTAAAVFNGGFTSNGDTNTFTSANATDPLVIIKNTTNDADSARLHFVKDKGAAGADGDDIGNIIFIADNDAQQQTTFASIRAEVSDASDGAEGGKLNFYVASHDGESAPGLVINDGSAEDEVDVTIGFGVASNTTTSGKLLTADGGKGLPSHSFSGDTNTGMFSNVADQIGFSAGGSEFFRIAANGSLSTPTLGASNVRFGVNAGDGILLNGNYNTVVGDEAGTAITISSYSTGLGYKALFSNVLGSKSTAVGGFALYSQNPAGASAVDMWNTAVGYDAGNGLTTGKKNTFIGALSGDAVVTGSENVAVGYIALTDLTSGTGNVAVGEECGSNITTGSSNVAMGKLALFTNISGSQNVAIGQEALRLNTGNNNLAIGFSALKNNAGGVTNVAIGHEAMLTNVDGDGNTAVGHEALKTMEPADGVSYNTAVGISAGKLVTTGTVNTYLGGLAGSANTVGHNNVALGYNALLTDSHGSQSVAVGVGALQIQDNGTTATNFLNTAVGYNAGVGVTTGINNTLIGALAGDNITTGDSNIIIGSGTDSVNATADNRLNIGGWIIGRDGMITKPSQPAFSVNPTSIQLNIAIDTAVTIIFGTERFDVGANFASNTFTAPVTGKYQLNVHLQLDNIDTASTLYQMQIVTSNKSYDSTIDPNFSADLNYYQITNSVLADMDEDDTVVIKLYQGGGTAQTDISINSQFSGYLAC